MERNRTQPRRFSNNRFHDLLKSLVFISVERDKSSAGNNPPTCQIRIIYRSSHPIFRFQFNLSLPRDENLHLTKIYLISPKRDRAAQASHRAERENGQKAVTPDTQQSLTSSLLSRAELDTRQNTHALKIQTCTHALTRSLALKYLDWPASPQGKEGRQSAYNYRETSLACLCYLERSSFFG